ALLVGDSVRVSLRELALARLGKTEGVVSSAQFFREQLAEPGATPVIALQGVVTHEKDGRRAGNVAVYGVDNRFSPQAPGDREIQLTAALARELNAQSGDTIL